ncbi:MAG: DUF935 family protein, partial [Bacteroidota bacterium]
MAKKRVRLTLEEKLELSERISLVNINDRFSTYPSKGLTPEKLAALLREADQGDIYRQMELFEEILEKDGHVMSLFGNIRLSVCGKNYEITTESEDELDKEIAKDAAKMLAKVKSWYNFVGNILDCAPKAISLQELKWEVNGDRIDFVGYKFINPKNLRCGKISDYQSDLSEIRLVIDPQNVEAFRGIVPDDQLKIAHTDGVALDCSPMFRKRFALAIAQLRSGTPARAALLRTIAYLYMFKNYDIKWWVRFAEIQLGIRLGKFDPSQPEQLAILKKAIANLGNDSAAVISKDSEIEFKELLQKAATFETYKELKDFCNAEMTKAILLHTAAVESTPGKLGNEETALDALQNLLEFYAKIVDEVITDDVLRPWVEMNYGVRETYPQYHTQIQKGIDLIKHANLLKLLQSIGLTLSKKYVVQKFGIPAYNPNDLDDEALSPSQL